MTHLVPETRPRWREDVTASVSIVVASVLLGAPAGLLWSAVSPRYTVEVTDSELKTPGLQSTKAFIGADGSYLIVMLLAGILCGVLAWRFARRSGPFTVLALLVGGVLAALIAQRIGLQPGSKTAVEALREGSPFRGEVDLFLGVRNQSNGDTSLRSAWAAVGWPVGAMVAFLSFAFRRPEELD